MLGGIRLNQARPLTRDYGRGFHAPEKIETTVRLVLGRNIKTRLQQLDVLAAAGYPTAVVVSAGLLVAVIRQPG